jgi:hypothetical protein
VTSAPRAADAADPYEYNHDYVPVDIVPPGLRVSYPDHDSDATNADRVIDQIGEETNSSVALDHLNLFAAPDTGRVFGPQPTASTAPNPFAPPLSGPQRR